MNNGAVTPRSGSDRSLLDELREANEQLVIAAMQAEQAAESTASDLANLAQASQHDVLTGTLNRKSMQECVDNAIRVAGRTRKRLATLFVDVDALKSVNDSFGHAAGDCVLQAVARRLQLAVRQTDTVGRYGGDEFVILLSPISRIADAALIAAKVNDAIAAPIVLVDRSISVSASVGIAIYPDDGPDGETLIDLADSAMYHSKRERPGHFAFHSGSTPDPMTEEVRASVAFHAQMPREIAVRRSPVPRRDLVDANERLIVAAIALQQAGGLAEEARVRQLRFMAMVAHEMRDPLAPLRSAAELLAHAQGGGDRLLLKARDIINRQVDRLARLVEDLIDGSRASTGHFRLRIAPVELVALLRLAVDACGLQMSAQKQTLSLELPELLKIEGDPVRLMQIFINLLENASKYTPQGGAIRLSATSASEACVVTVADDGIGIGRETLPHIFDLFVQEPGERARRNGGLGIGLAIVRQLVEAHGGTVLARSDGIDRGSEFVVTLPLLAVSVGGAGHGRLTD